MVQSAMSLGRLFTVRLHMLPGGYRATRPTPKGEGAGEAFFIGGFMLTQKRLKELLHYDEQTGIFTWVNSFRGTAKGTRAGSIKSNGYRDIMISNKKYMEHRLAWLYVYGAFPSGVIDHIDHNASNNSICNLRDVSISVNNQNQIRCTKNNKTSGLLGVHWNKRYKKWEAKICINKKQKYIGLFDTPEKAHEAYLTKKRSVHEGNTL